MLLLALFLAVPAKVPAQVQEAIQLGLNIEKLEQLRQILRSMYRGYEILTQGYNKVKELSSGNFRLHEVFLDGLMIVSPAVKNYRRVADIVTAQLQLSKEYRRAFDRFRSGGRFMVSEIDYMSRVYGNLLGQSIANLDELLVVITSSKLRMSDAERLSSIDRIYEAMDRKLHFLRRFNEQTTVLDEQRKLERRELNFLSGAYK